MKKRLPEIKRNRKSDNENTTKSDGASLAMGSSEYREMVADRKGMDEFDQKNVKLDKAKSSKFSRKDDFHDELAKDNADFARDLNQNYLELDSGQLSTAERDVSHQIRKAALTDATLKVARREAAKTETTADDKAVRRRLPKVLEEDVYNNDVTEDDYYPGYKTLSKFM